ncbi:MAG: 23S rRNA (guanosine(2251)-2'-O)-methyltransferase RlmB [Microcoleaceae cyanobacterium]
MPKPPPKSSRSPRRSSSSSGKDSKTNSARRGSNQAAKRPVSPGRRPKPSTDRILEHPSPQRSSQSQPNSEVQFSNHPGNDSGSNHSEHSNSPDLIYGLHPVIAALRGGRSLNRIWVLPQLRSDSRFQALLLQAKADGTVIDDVTTQHLDRMLPDANHQGIVAQVTPYVYHDFDQLVAQAKSCPDPVLLVAEGVTDPHNLGAIIRTAEAFGVQGLILHQRRAVGITSTVMKVAAGALESFSVARVTNLNRVLETLKTEGFWIYGTASEASQPLHKTNLTGAVALVVGSEGQGLSRSIEQKCDVLVQIPLAGNTPSLNVSVATGVAIYEIYRQRC